MALEAGNFFRFNKYSRYLTSRVFDLKDALRPPKTDDEIMTSLHKLAQAARICPPSGLLSRLEAKLRQRIAQLDPSKIDWDAHFPHSQPNVIRKGIILKKPVSEKEKGILFIAFEDHWLRLLRFADLERLAQDYHLVLAPTWSPPHDVPFLLASKMWKEVLFHIVSNFDDIPIFSRLADNLVTIPLLSSSWVDPNLFSTDEPVEKEFDIVMLANFATYKRHFLLFRALREMPPSTRVLLLGKPMEGRTVETIMAEADAYGVADRITIRQGLPDKEMVRSFRSAKVSLITSGNEGSCVAVVESMFADIPVGLMEDAIVGSIAYVNEHTGVLLKYRHLGKQLSDFIARADSFSPRRWVMENDISCLGSSKLLNRMLKDALTQRGEEWTQDVCVLHFRPNPTYFYKEDEERMRDAYEDFEAKYGVTIVPNLVV